MSLPISFTEKDLLRGKLVKPDWYRVRIDEITDSLSSKGDSTNYQVDYTIIKNANTGDEEFAGVPGSWWFNSKAAGFMKGYFESLGVNVQSGQRYDLKATEGKELEVFIRNEMYNNRMTNKVNHEYRPLSN